jgi:hypothetical protein
MSDSITHEQLRKAAMACLKRSTWDSKCGFGCNIILSELVSSAAEIPDAIGWVWGSSVLIECKVSRSDFFADAKKTHRLSGTGSGERRFFLTPPSLIGPEELPEGWGLLELHGRSVKQIVDCERRPIDLASHQSEKRMLLSTISRIRMREFLIISREAVDEVLA